MKAIGAAKGRESVDGAPHRQRLWWRCPKQARRKSLCSAMQEVPNVRGKTLQEFVDAHIQNGATIECDGFNTYKGLKNVAVDAKVYDCAAGDLKWLHKTLSNLKAFLTGTYHGRCVYLQSYLDEYCFRFNRRHSTDQLFARLTRAVAVSSIAV